MKATILYCIEDKDSTKMGFQVLVPKEKKIWVRNPICNGIPEITCDSGYIRPYAEIIVGCFEEESNFITMLRRKYQDPNFKIYELKELVLIFNDLRIHVFKKTTAQDIENEYIKTIFQKHE